MSHTLSRTQYGKAAVRVVRVVRHRDRHDLRDVTVDVAVEGGFDAAYTSGDNTLVLPTDTIKNTVYALAQRHGIPDLEPFGLTLGEHLLRGNPEMPAVRVDLTEHLWQRAGVGDRLHPHAFVGRGPERRLATVTRSTSAVTVSAGIDALALLKTTGSAFAGFRRDAYTTLEDAEDRILATTVRATWTYDTVDVAFGETWRQVQQTLVAAFADHNSRSVQHTLHAMGDSVLSSFDRIAEISLSMPNRHHITVDLAPFGLANANEVFVATTEPYGLIEATLRRTATA